MRKKEINLFEIRAKNAIEWSAADAKTKVLLLALVQEVATLAKKMSETK